MQAQQDNAQQFDLVIVGAGMIGAALAASLLSAQVSQQRDLRIALLDSAAQASLLRTLPELADEQALSVSGYEPRVSALTQSSLALLQELGAWQYVQTQRVQAYQHMQVWDELGTGQVHFDAAELHSESLGCIVENQNLVQALHRVLAAEAKVQGFYGQKIESLSRQGLGSSLRLSDGQILETKLLVAADGANSFVRQRLGFETREWDYGHQAIVATVAMAQSHQATAWQRFSEQGPLALLPLRGKGQDGQGYCSIVWSQQTERARELMALDDAEFMAALTRASEGRLGAVQAVSERFSYPLRQRHAKTYVKPGAVLVGDAAHTIHPLAGQGVNQGFKDVVSLTEVLSKAKAQGVPLGHEYILKRYQRQRQGDNLMMMASMEGFKQLFGSASPALRLLRNTGMAWLNDQQFLKTQLARKAMGLV